MKLKVPKGQKIDVSKIYNPVESKNLIQRKPKKITDLIELAEQNPKIMTELNQHKARFNRRIFCRSLASKLKV